MSEPCQNLYGGAHLVGTGSVEPAELDRLAQSAGFWGIDVPSTEPTWVQTVLCIVLHLPFHVCPSHRACR